MIKSRHHTSASQRTAGYVVAVHDVILSVTLVEPRACCSSLKSFCLFSLVISLLSSGCAQNSFEGGDLGVPSQSTVLDSRVRGGVSAGEEVSAGDDLTGGESSGAVVVITPSAGEATISAGESGSCTSRDELCNGLDDDCDQRVDEEFDRLGDLCEVGLGACLSAGELTCGPNGVSLVCAAEIASPSPELCNERDDDCDGVIDEEVAQCCRVGDTRPCGMNLGVCTVGAQTCSTDGWSACDGVGPSEERCDGVDNDCDQLTDEGLLNICGACGETPTEVCDQADNDCDGRTDEGVTNACGECGVTPDEVCDGADNDCDNRVDEGVTNQCGSCGVAPVEVCDGVDNDCDDRVDEGALNACGQCGAAPIEICDDADNDCDGRVDEGLGVGEPCAAGVGACRRDGVRICGARGRVRCSAQAALPEDEECDLADNDCDGAVDEDFDLNSDQLHCGSCNSLCLVSGTCTQGECGCGGGSACEPGFICNPDGNCVFFQLP